MIPYIAAFLFAALLALIRLVKGPTTPDRMVALDTCGILVVGLHVLMAVHYDKPYLLDVAIVYALLTFIATSTLSRYLRGEL